MLFLNNFRHNRYYSSRSKARLFFVLMLFCLIIMYSISPASYNYSFFKLLKPLDNITCYYDSTNDILLSTEDENYLPAPDSIFFHETSCRGGIDSKQACAIEAAARAHTNREVHLLLSGPVKSYNGTLNTLKTIPNVYFARVHLKEYAKGTPAEAFVASGGLEKSRWRFVHTADILRFLSLYKWGGVYLDLDTVVVKSFESLARNWFVKESDNDMCNGAISLSMNEDGRQVADLLLRNAVDNFRGDRWSNNGPYAVTRTLKDYCSTREVALMSVDTCKGIEIYANALFMPISSNEPERHFLPGVLNWPWVYCYHVWEASETDIPDNSRYANLAKQYCPSVYNSHSEDFGVKLIPTNT